MLWKRLPGTVENATGANEQRLTVLGASQAHIWEHVFWIMKKNEKSGRYYILAEYNQDVLTSAKRLIMKALRFIPSRCRAKNNWQAQRNLPLCHQAEGPEHGRHIQKSLSNKTLYARRCRGADISRAKYTSVMSDGC
ncbi:hypothetical protein F7725_027796 [Dissostichus mawsoni]|uniref:Uncharacterized protein n=1 Tax=Dissostichus mawsoni TaxID=36200 RepID=A0A7J5XG92_DISMA|nr:hypothetical protein F7725_027796 [Dissostichus mawsoni]